MSLWDIVATSSEEIDFWDSMSNKISSSVSGWRRQRAVSKLESSIQKILETANCNKDKGRGNGDPVFVDLYKRANGYIAEFCREWNESEESVRAQMPALHDLKRYAEPVVTPPKIFLGILGLIGIIMVPVLIGVTAGLVGGGFHAVTQVLHHILPKLF